MRLELKQYKENMDKESSLLGHALVEMGDKMEAWFSIVRSKKGTTFCNVASIRVDGEFHPSFSLNNQETMKKLCFDILDLVKAKYNLDK